MRADIGGTDESEMETHRMKKESRTRTMSEQIKWGNFCDSVQAWTSEADAKWKIICEKHIEVLRKNNNGRVKRMGKEKQRHR